jgi:hypothetical protein
MSLDGFSFTFCQSNDSTLVIPSNIPLMAQVRPALGQSPHQELPPLLRSQPAQEAVSPLPHKVRRVVCVAGSAADLHACKSGRRRDLAHDVERLGRGGECRGSGAGGRERGRHGRGGEHGTPRVEEGHVARPGTVRSVCLHGWLGRVRVQVRAVVLLRHGGLEEGRWARDGDGAQAAEGVHGESAVDSCVNAGYARTDDSSPIDYCSDWRQRLRCGCDHDRCARDLRSLADTDRKSALPSPCAQKLQLPSTAAFCHPSSKHFTKQPLSTLQPKRRPSLSSAPTWFRTRRHRTASSRASPSARQMPRPCCKPTFPTRRRTRTCTPMPLLHQPA